MLNRSSLRVTVIPCLNTLTIKLKGKTKRNNGQSDILSVLLELLFQQLPSFCLETFKCLNELIVPRVGTEPNIVAMIITGFVDNLFILEEFALWPSRSKQCLNEQFIAFGEISLRETKLGSFSGRIEIHCIIEEFASNISKVNKSEGVTTYRGIVYYSVTKCHVSVH